MTRRERLPAPVHGCQPCRSGNMSASRARAEAIRTKRLHAKHAFDGWAERYRNEALTAKALADADDARYFAHHAEAHAVPSVVLPGTDNDRAPSHAKPALPPAADLAVRLRAGESLDDVASEYDRKPATLARNLNLAGFRSTGEPYRRKDSAGVLVPIREWSFPEWVDQALCAQTDPGLFYPEHQGASAMPAKRICAVCPVRIKCLEYALTTGDAYGIYGGTTARERRKMKKAAS